MMQAAEDFYDLRKTYLERQEGGMKRRQNSTWANDSKMMGTPLAACDDVDQIQPQRMSRVMRVIPWMGEVIHGIC